MKKRVTMMIALGLIIANVLACSSCTLRELIDAENDGTGTQVNDETEKETEIDMTNVATPEKMGISSSDITKVVEGLAKEGLSIHSMLVMKDGVVVAEGYAEPIDENYLHRMYSVSKSFASMAIGILEGEGKISLDDTIGKYFPEYVTKETDERILNCTIENLLMMATPFTKVASCGDGQEDWIEAFFEGTTQKDPGTSFTYDTGASHLLGAIVERETGMNFLEYLKEKALLEIGFSEDSWCIKGPEGYAWAGSGVMCTSRDLALFANLVMNNGAYNGKQLIPEAYVKAATSYKIATKEAEGDSEFYGRGYGYQIWINPYGFSFMGMGGQFAYCVPDKGLVIVFTADNQGNSEAAEIVYNLIVENIIKKASDEQLPENVEAYLEMTAALENMEIPYISGNDTSKKLSSIDGKTFVCTDENAKITSFKFDFDGDEGELTYMTPRGKKTLKFGIGKNVECNLYEPQYYGDTIGTPNNKGYRSLCSGAWKSDTVFILRVQVVDDYFGNMTFVFNLGNNPTLNVTKTAEWFLNEYKISNASYKKQ